MNVLEAAKYIGCSPGHIRNLIANGKLKHTKIEVNHAPGYILDIPRSEAIRYKKLVFLKGWRRGRKRKSKTKTPAEK